MSQSDRTTPETLEFKGVVLRLRMLPFRLQRKAAITATYVLLLVAIGCGRWDLGGVRGQVVSQGKPRGFTPLETMNLTFSTELNSIPRTYIARVKTDGTFVADLNDGSGRGIPFGTYKVGVDVGSVIINEAAGPAGSSGTASTPGGDAYPTPSPSVVKRLRGAECTIEVTAGTPRMLVVDIDNGTIQEMPRR